jgi:hypothetical protein
MMDAILFAMLWLVETVATYSLGAVVLATLAVAAFTAVQSLRIAYRGHPPLGCPGGA